ncbi:MAG: secretin N-terminal domain-containing protein [Gemmata sp.]
MRATLLALALLPLAPVGAPRLAAQQPQTVNVFKLKNADAEKLRPILTAVFGRQGVTVTVDARTNSLIVAADKTTLEEVRKLVEKLDEPVRPMP